MGSYCTIAGSIAPTPGISYEAKATTYQLNGTMDCTSEEPSHGAVTGTGTGTTGCFGGSSAAVLKIAWDNGTVSTVNAQLGDFMYGTGGQGMVDEGTFEGDHVYLGWGRQAARAEESRVRSITRARRDAGVVAVLVGIRHREREGADLLPAARVRGPWAVAALGSGWLAAALLIAPGVAAIPLAVAVWATCTAVAVR